MQSARQVWNIALRDLLQRARSRAFLVSTALIVAVVLGAGPLLALSTGSRPDYDIGIAGRKPLGIEVALAEAALSLDVSVSVVNLGSELQSRSALGDGDVDVVIVDGSRLLWRTEPSPGVAGLVVAGLEAVERRRVAEDLGLSDAEVRNLLDPLSLQNEALQTAEVETTPRRAAAVGGSVLLYMAILIFGQFVLLGVLEEKANRVVEVVLSRVRPRQILAGKVIGLGLLGLAQLFVIGLAVIATLVAVNDRVAGDLPAIGLEVLRGVLVWFLLGYTFFAVVYAALGALVSRQEDVQGVAILPVLLLLPGYFISLTALPNPETTLVRVASMVPPTSPLVMPMRAAVVEVPWWESLVAVGLLGLSVYGLIVVGDRIYRGGILRLGAAVRLRDAWRSAER
jgi:ABC-2 type transport system permease protein